MSEVVEIVLRNVVMFGLGAWFGWGIGFSRGRDKGFWHGRRVGGPRDPEAMGMNPRGPDPSTDPQ